MPQTSASRFYRSRLRRRAAEASDAITLARDTNDYLAGGVRKHPARLAGFATVPTAAPDQAAAELERTVRDYGFKGAMINGHIRGRYLDDKFFWPSWRAPKRWTCPFTFIPHRLRKP